MKDLTLVQVRALAAFTKTTRNGQFHGDPNGLTDRSRLPFVPDYTVAALVAKGKVALLDGSETSSPSPAATTVVGVLVTDAPAPAEDKRAAALAKANAARKAKADARKAEAPAPAEDEKLIEPRELAEGEMLAEGEGGPEGEPIPAPAGSEDDAPVD